MLLSSAFRKHRLGLIEYQSRVTRAPKITEGLHCHTTSCLLIPCRPACNWTKHREVSWKIHLHPDFPSCSNPHWSLIFLNSRGSHPRSPSHNLFGLVAAYISSPHPNKRQEWEYILSFFSMPNKHSAEQRSHQIFDQLLTDSVRFLNFYSMILSRK